jgi:hypothetical protein
LKDWGWGCCWMLLVFWGNAYDRLYLFVFFISFINIVGTRGIDLLKLAKKSKD